MKTSSTLSRRRLIAASLSAILLVACARTDAPTEPVWGKEPCAHCKMLVSDRRYAAQIVDEAGERRFFDDVGCMVLWMDGREPPERAWVRESTSGAWLDPRAAAYEPGARTPMDFGFEARSGGGLAFDAVRAAVLDENRRGRAKHSRSEHRHR